MKCKRRNESVRESTGEEQESQEKVNLENRNHKENKLC